MTFLLDTDRKGVQTALGELSYRIGEEERDGTPIPRAYLILGLNKFFTDIKQIKCDIGIFQNTRLISISGGTKDNVVLYELESSDFSFNVEKIEERLATKEKELVEEGEV